MATVPEFRAEITQALASRGEQVAVDEDGDISVNFSIDVPNVQTINCVQLIQFNVDDTMVDSMVTTGVNIPDHLRVPVLELFNLLNGREFFPVRFALDPDRGFPIVECTLHSDLGISYEMGGRAVYHPRWSIAGLIVALAKMKGGMSAEDAFDQFEELDV